MRKKSKKSVNIYITKPDYQRLSGLIEITRERNGIDREYLNKLEAELDRADIVDPKHIPADVITMRSKVRLKDLVSGEAIPIPSCFQQRRTLAKARFLYWHPSVRLSWVTNEEIQLSGPYPPVCAGLKLTRSFISPRLRETTSFSLPTGQSGMR